MSKNSRHDDDVRKYENLCWDEYKGQDGILGNKNNIRTE